MNWTATEFQESFFENIFSFAVKDYTFVLSDVCWTVHHCDN